MQLVVSQEVYGSGVLEAARVDPSLSGAERYLLIQEVDYREEVMRRQEEVYPWSRFVRASGLGGPDVVQCPFKLNVELLCFGELSRVDDIYDVRVKQHAIVDIKEFLGDVERCGVGEAVHAKCSAVGSCFPTFSTLHPSSPQSSSSVPDDGATSVDANVLPA